MWRIRLAKKLSKIGSDGNEAFAVKDATPQVIGQFPKAGFCSNGGNQLGHVSARKMTLNQWMMNLV